jgi:hypothetical protein
VKSFSDCGFIKRRFKHLYIREALEISAIVREQLGHSMDEHRRDDEKIDNEPTFDLSGL